MLRFLCMFVLVCIFGSVASAVRAEPGDVYACCELVMRIRADDGGQTIAKRADLATGQITEHLLGLDPFEPNKLVIVQVSDRNPCIYYKGDLIVTVDEVTASANGLTAIQLASVWVANLKSVVPGVKAIVMTE